MATQIAVRSQEHVLPVGSEEQYADTLPAVPPKLRYEIDLSGLTPVSTPHDVHVRSISRDDLEDLARLMLDSYAGTIDYDEESLGDAMEEVRSFLDDDRALLDKSRGLARLVTNTALERLAGDGHETVVLYITGGNTPSEALFRSVGAVQTDA